MTTIQGEPSGARPDTGEKESTTRGKLDHPIEREMLEFQVSGSTTVPRRAARRSAAPNRARTFSPYTDFVVRREDWLSRE